MTTMHASRPPLCCFLLLLQLLAIEPITGVEERTPPQMETGSQTGAGVQQLSQLKGKPNQGHHGERNAVLKTNPDPILHHKLHRDKRSPSCPRCVPKCVKPCCPKCQRCCSRQIPIIYHPPPPLNKHVSHFKLPAREQTGYGNHPGLNHPSSGGENHHSGEGSQDGGGYTSSEGSHDSRQPKGSSDTSSGGEGESEGEGRQEGEEMEEYPGDHMGSHSNKKGHEDEAISTDQDILNPRKLVGRQGNKKRRQTTKSHMSDQIHKHRQPVRIKVQHQYQYHLVPPVFTKPEYHPPVVIRYGQKPGTKFHHDEGILPHTHSLGGTTPKKGKGKKKVSSSQEQLNHDNPDKFPLKEEEGQGHEDLNLYYGGNMRTPVQQEDSSQDSPASTAPQGLYDQPTFPILGNPRTMQRLPPPAFLRRSPAFPRPWLPQRASSSFSARQRQSTHKDPIRKVVGSNGDTKKLSSTLQKTVTSSASNKHKRSHLLPPPSLERSSAAFIEPDGSLDFGRFHDLIEKQMKADLGDSFHSTDVTTPAKTKAVATPKKIAISKAVRSKGIYKTSIQRNNTASVTKSVSRRYKNVTEFRNSTSSPKAKGSKEQELDTEASRLLLDVVPPPHGIQVTAVDNAFSKGYHLIPDPGPKHPTTEDWFHGHPFQGRYVEFGVRDGAHKVPLKKQGTGEGGFIDLLTSGGDRLNKPQRPHGKVPGKTTPQDKGILQDHPQPQVIDLTGSKKEDHSKGKQPFRRVLPQRIPDIDHQQTKTPDSPAPTSPSTPVASDKTSSTRRGLVRAHRVIRPVIHRQVTTPLNHPLLTPRPKVKHASTVHYKNNHKKVAFQNPLSSANLVPRPNASGWIPRRYPGEDELVRIDTPVGEHVDGSDSERRYIASTPSTDFTSAEDHDDKVTQRPSAADASGEQENSDLVDITSAENSTNRNDIEETHQDNDVKNAIALPPPIFREATKAGGKTKERRGSSTPPSSDGNREFEGFYERDANPLFGASFIEASIPSNQLPSYEHNQGFTSPRPTQISLDVNRNPTEGYTYPGVRLTTTRRSYVHVDNSNRTHFVATGGRGGSLTKAEFQHETENLAYILIGTCCALSIFCLIVVILTMRCRKSCHRDSEDKLEIHHSKYVDWEDGILESHVTHGTSTTKSTTTHKLGTWFNGRNSALTGTAKGSLALPTHFKCSSRGALYTDGKTALTRDLLVIASENTSSREKRQMNVSDFRSYEIATTIVEHEDRTTRREISSPIVGSYTPPWSDEDIVYDPTGGADTVIEDRRYDRDLELRNCRKLLREDDGTISSIATSRAALPVPLPETPGERYADNWALRRNPSPSDEKAYEEDDDSSSSSNQIVWSSNQDRLI